MLEDYLDKIICGDCLEVMRGMPDGCVDAVITDPPYGIGFTYESGRESFDSPKEYWEWLSPIIRECTRLLKNGGFLAVWQAQLNFPYFWDWFGRDIHIYCSAKNFVQIRKNSITYAYDPVVMRYIGEPHLKPDKPKRTMDFFVSNTASVVSNPNRIEKGHPCPRPLDGVREILVNFTLPAGIILDPFLGSGTTAVACKETGRHFIGIELEEKYCEIARRRVAETSEPLFVM